MGFSCSDCKNGCHKMDVKNRCEWCKWCRYMVLLRWDFNGRSGFPWGFSFTKESDLRTWSGSRQSWERREIFSGVHHFVWLFVYRLSIIWLVVESYPSEKYEIQLEWLLPIYGKIKHLPNHRPVTVFTICQVSSGNKIPESHSMKYWLVFVGIPLLYHHNPQYIG